MQTLFGIERTPPVPGGLKKICIQYYTGINCMKMYALYVLTVTDCIENVRIIPFWVWQVCRIE